MEKVLGGGKKPTHWVKRGPKKGSLGAGDTKIFEEISLPPITRHREKTSWKETRKNGKSAVSLNNIFNLTRGTRKRDWGAAKRKAEVQTSRTKRQFTPGNH